MKRISSKLTGKAGFTLVELVVVIAVLAILAGVGAVAYNGYITYAKKGQDRALVGEILHAFELADYSDPSLFTDGDSATFYFMPSSGAKVLKRNNQEVLKKSLEDALGDLKSLSLTYQDWKSTALGGSAMADLISSEGMGTIIEDENSLLNQYFSAEGKASYADEMPELWEAVGKNLDALFSTNILQRVIESSTNSSAVPAIKERWKAKESFTLDMPGFTGNEGLALEVARNYAFAAFVEGKYGDQLTDPMKETLNRLKTTNGLAGGIYYNQCTGSEWTINGVNLIDDYIDTQAEADALAYLALMESVSTVSYTDENDLREKISSVVDGVGPLMNKSVDVKSYADFLTEVGDGGSVVGFSVTKTNGVLVPSNFSDPDLNPRGSGSGSSGEAPVTCSPEDHTGPAATLNLEGDGTDFTADQTIVLCTRNAEYKSCTVTLTGGALVDGKTLTDLNATVSYQNNLVTFDPATGTITVTGSGSGTDVITINVEVDLGIGFTFPQNYYINVTVH